MPIIASISQSLKGNDCLPQCVLVKAVSKVEQVVLCFQNPSIKKIAVMTNRNNGYNYENVGTQGRN